MRKIFLGIDLGTTNSVIGYSTVTGENIVSNVIDIEMTDENGGRVKGKTIPSVICFDKNMTPIVGRYAKSMINKASSRVIKSIKSKMGTNEVRVIENEKITPVVGSSYILKHLYGNIKRTLGYVPENVVITIPASFDSDMRRDTLEAAELAGFSVKDKDGNFKKILLSEPRAALYDFVNLQNQNQIPRRIDFSGEKTCLVFDLGGGTLDVSVHSLYMENHKVKIRDLGISRYSQIGGDLFDSLFRDYLLNDFLGKERKHFSAKDVEALKGIFLEYAEEVKIELNDKIDNALFMGRGVDGNLSVDLIKMGILDDYFYSTEISLDKYRSVVSPLLASELKLSDVNSIDNIKNSNNIIYPILDAMKKASDKLGKGVDIDFVLLNGGMTKLQIVKDRISDFFGFEPLSSTDQDQAVARGASVYSKMMEDGIFAEEILNDTISLERAGNEVFPLALAGTVLPYKVKYDIFTVQNNGATFIDLPIYSGRGKTTALPNRKLAEKRIKFQKPLCEGDKVALEVKISELGVVEILGIVENNSKFSLTVDVNSSEDSEEKEKPTSASNQEGKTIVLKSTKKAPSISTNRINEDLENTLDNHKNYINLVRSATTVSNKLRFTENMKDCEKKILTALNREDFLKQFIHRVKKENTEIKGRYCYLIGELVKAYPQYKNIAGKVYLELISLEELIKIGNRNMPEYMKLSVEGLRKIEYTPAAKHLAEVFRYPNCKPLGAAIIMALGTLGSDKVTLNILIDSLVNNKVHSVNSYWAIGRISTIDRENPLERELFSEVLKRIAKSINKENNNEVVRNMLYSVAEICQRNKSLDKKLRQDLINEITDVTPQINSVKTIREIALQILDERVLTTDQKRELLAIRTFI